MIKSILSDLAIISQKSWKKKRVYALDQTSDLPSPNLSFFIYKIECVGNLLFFPFNLLSILSTLISIRRG